MYIYHDSKCYDYWRYYNLLVLIILQSFENKSIESVSLYEIIFFTGSVFVSIIVTIIIGPKIILKLI